MVRQQYAKAIAGLVVPWGLILVLLIYMKLVKSGWVINPPTDSQGNPKDESKITQIEKEEISFSILARLIVTKVAPIVLCLICGVWGLVRLSSSILYLVNPEYYAVRDLLQMVLAPGSGM